MCGAVKNINEVTGMTKLDMAGIAVLCVFGLVVIAVVVSIAPDLRRYIKISRM